MTIDVTVDESLHDDDESLTSDRQLPPDLILRILQLLPPNDLALSGRRTLRAAWQRFRLHRHATVHVSQPLPAYILHTAWAQACAAEALKHLPFQAKLLCLSTATASGSETNTSFAWSLVQPCLFPGLTPTHYVPLFRPHPDPGVAAAQRGKPHLLPWLVSHGCPLDPRRTLAALAQHCNMTQLQSAAQTLRLINNEEQGLGQGRAAVPSSHRYGGITTAAAASTTPDSLEKLQWLVEHLGCELTDEAPAAAAAAAGAGGVASGLPTLQWLRERGCPFQALKVLVAALRRADLTVCEWLLDVAGCALPAPGPGISWRSVCGAAAAAVAAPAGGPAAGAAGRQASGGGGAGAGAGAEVDCRGVAKLRWLLQRSSASDGPSHTMAAPHRGAIHEAARAGHMDTVSFLHQQCGLALTSSMWEEVAASGCVRLAEWVAGRGEQAPLFWGREYAAAAARGQLAMVRWLAGRGRCPWGEETVAEVIASWPRWVSDASGCGSSSCSCCSEKAVSCSAADCGGVRYALQPGQEAARQGAGSQGACRGLLEAVQVLLQAGAPAGGMASVNAAARRGDLALMRYLVEEAGCGLGGGALLAAAESGCVALVEWVAAREGEGRAPRQAQGAEDVGGVFVLPARRGDRATLECLLRLGLRPDWLALQGSEPPCPAEVLGWLLEAETR